MSSLGTIPRSFPRRRLSKCGKGPRGSGDDVSRNSAAVDVPASCCAAGRPISGACSPGPQDQVHLAHRKLRGVQGNHGDPEDLQQVRGWSDPVWIIAEPGSTSGF